MTEFDFGSLKKKKDTKIIPTPSPRKTTRTVQRKTEKTTTTLTKDDLQSFKEDLLTSLKQAIPQTPELEQIGLIHTFNRENLIQFVGRRGKRGTKLCELRDFFYPTPAGEIDTEVQKLRKEGIIQKNRSGWMSLRKQRSK